MNKIHGSEFAHYIAIEGYGEYPRLFCPVCGNPITFRNEACPHLLFVAQYESMEAQVFVDYVHPKLNKTDEALSRELSGTQPIDLASSLNLNPASTLVMSIENLFNGPISSDLLQVVAVVEFPPCSDALKAWKRHPKNPINAGNQ
jgi:hypothetical protein